MQAFACQVGKTTTFVGQIERGEKFPSMEVFIQILQVLGVSSDFLLSNSIEAGKPYVLSELTEKLSGLTAQEQRAVAAIVDAYIATLPEQDLDG